eukprot:6192620-Pleurochrysis_carterae.AAC.2
MIETSHCDRASPVCLPPGRTGMSSSPTRCASLMQRRLGLPLSVPADTRSLLCWRSLWQSSRQQGAALPSPHAMPTPCMPGLPPSAWCMEPVPFVRPPRLFTPCAALGHSLNALSTTQLPFITTSSLSARRLRPSPPGRRLSVPAAGAVYGICMHGIVVCFC